MELESVLELKNTIEKSLRAEARRRGGAQAQALVNPRTEGRLAVGYSQKTPKDYQLELRVQRSGGTAYRQAVEYKKQAKDEANIEVVPLIEIPSRGAVVEDQQSPNPLRTSRRPLHIGLSVGHSNGGSGTLGAFVVGDGGEEYILSNNHVLALMGQAKKNEPIYQPGSSDVPFLKDSDSIALLSNYIVLSKGKRNSLDSAVAALLQEMEHEGNRIPRDLGYPMEGQSIVGIDDITNLDITKHEAVCKIGRTTGFTEGLLTAIALDNVTVRTPIGNVIFDDVLEITSTSEDQPFSLPGDSGSLVFRKQGREAIGLHFAGGTKLVEGKTVWVSYSCNLSSVLRAHDVSLI